MQPLIEQEKFELEVLDKLNSKRLLDPLIFCGGTMLRLCYGLNRFSVDLDFWILKKMELKDLFSKIKSALEEDYSVKDAAIKFYTLLFEIKSKNFPRSLKIEIRKEEKKIAKEQAIAYSPYSTKQILLNAVSLSDMMAAKIDTFLNRKEIRDVFDMEFLLKKGILLEAPKEKLNQLLAALDSLTQKDYTVKLGSLLEEKERKYYIKENFKLLKGAIAQKLL